jgi:hypothetical protein
VHQKEEEEEEEERNCTNSTKHFQVPHMHQKNFEFPQIPPNILPKTISK